MQQESDLDWWGGVMDTVRASKIQMAAPCDKCGGPREFTGQKWRRGIDIISWRCEKCGHCDSYEVETGGNVARPL